MPDLTSVPLPSTAHARRLNHVPAQRTATQPKRQRSEYRTPYANRIEMIKGFPNPNTLKIHGGPIVTECAPDRVSCRQERLHGPTQIDHSFDVMTTRMSVPIGISATISVGGIAVQNADVRRIG